MSFLRVLFCLILLCSFVVVPLQINLDLTGLVGDDDNYVVYQHDCLHLPIWTEDESDPREITSFCMSEWPSKWNIQKNDLDQNFTFAELFKLSVTSQQLYLWSASMDIIEQYQLYLDQLSTSNEALISMDIYYNCTLPRFGPMCQYQLDDYEPHHTSMNEIMYDFYRYSQFSQYNQSCYTHLQCNVGLSSVCISWLNICDGIIQCINRVDEEHCWQLEINECKVDEYRCRNGQCIPLTFYTDSAKAPDCLDGSDEQATFVSGFPPEPPLQGLKYEDITCGNSFHAALIPGSINDHCRDTYGIRFANSLFSERPDSMSDECWFALNCYFCLSYLFPFTCDNTCGNEAYKKIINDSCPDMFYLPDAPIAFGHIYIAFTKRYIVEQTDCSNEPEYVCYNEQLCGGFYPNRTLLAFNNTICRKPQDFPLNFSSSVWQDVGWASKYILFIYEQLSRCNTVLRNDSEFCANSTMYQCINSSKCISKIRLFDGTDDCDYGDDELLISENGTCPIDSAGTHIYCREKKECYSRNMITHTDCLCDEYQSYVCLNVHGAEYFLKKYISFPTICDGHTELEPIYIDGQNETDETECGQWLCNNTYTRCDGIMHCFNGADEADCSSLSLLNCPIHSYICISPENNEFMCLSINKTNDGEIDCLGAFDEPQLNPATEDQLNSDKFYCKKHTTSQLLTMLSHHLCNDESECLQEEDEQFCSNHKGSGKRSSICLDSNAWLRSDVEEFMCNYVDSRREIQIIHFSLDGTRKPTESLIKSDADTALKHSSITRSTRSLTHHCHRSLSLRVWLDSEKKLFNTTCLCPQSYYGDRCQYQNQRVALTMQFRTFSDSWRTSFIIIVLLIDDSDERTIHSHEQFTYFPMQSCQRKFNIDLLYSTRPKNQSKQYSIHIDIYEKISLSYRASLLIRLPFPFLSAHRIAVQLNISQISDNFKSCSDHQCVNGQCTQYFDDPKNTSFCQCNPGWTGRYCTIQHTCTCSIGSLCIGVLTNNRSLCVCPINKWGSGCLLHDEICQANGNTTCRNGGQCIPADRYAAPNKQFKCICRQGFFGERCEIAQNKIIVSFHKDVILPRSMLVHFFEVKDDAPPENGTTFKTIPLNRYPVTVYWARPFHIAFAEFHPNNYYLLIVQNSYNRSVTTQSTLNPSDRCLYISEVFNESFAKAHLLRRIKYYHVPCQRTSPKLSCFYDDDYMCLCNDFGDQRTANCFEFDYRKKFTCNGQSVCKHGAQCLQDSINCPETSMCVCLPCFYGTLCQFSSSAFSLSLDAILGDYIQPHISIIQQPLIIQISVTLTVLMTILGLINGIMSLMTFMNKDPCKTGCGFYLIGSSITTLVIMILFSVKFWILVGAQMTYMTNKSFLHFQCSSIDFLLRIGLNMDQWLNACVALERAITSIKGLNFDKNKSKKIAKLIIPALLLLTIGTNIHDPLYRELTEDDSNDEKRIWCTATYPPNIQVFNLVMSIFHFCGPLIINLMSALIVTFKTTRLRTTVKTDLNYRKVLSEQFQKHKHIFITPLLLVALAIPRLIISFTSGCMKSGADSWLFLIGYFISFIPPMLTFIIFVLPSKLYKQEFRNTVKHYKKTIRVYIHRSS